MAKGTFSLLDSIKYREKYFVENEIETVCGFSEQKVEKSLLTLKRQDFIKRARCQKMSKENWVATAAISFLLTILPTHLSSLHHRACPAPATTKGIRYAVLNKTIQDTFV